MVSVDDLIATRDAQRETARELRTGSTDCNTAYQAIHWDRLADETQAKIAAAVAEKEV